MAFTTVSIIKVFGQSIEKAVNIGLSVDPAARQKLKPLRGCILEVSISSPKITLLFEVDADQIKILPGNVKPTVVFEGSALTLFKLATIKDKNWLFKTKELRLTGDAVRSQQIQTFVRSLRIDWEALLAELIGDVPAHFINSTLTSGYRWGLSASNSLIRDIEEFVKYELNLLPTRSASQLQQDAINKLRQATVQLEKRVKRLSKQTERA